MLPHRGYSCRLLPHTVTPGNKETTPFFVQLSKESTERLLGEMAELLG